MFCRFSSLRFLAANACKLAATRSTTPPAFNLLLHTSTACKGTPKKPDETEKEADPELSNLIKRTDSLNIDERPKVAVLLAGCGLWDGTIPLEAVSLSIHLDRHNIKADYYSQPYYIPKAINHLFKVKEEFTRKPHNIKDPEALRTAYDDARRMMDTRRLFPMRELKNYECNRFYGGLFIPGGIGATVGLFTQFMRPIVKSFAQGEKKRAIGTISNGGYGTARVLNGVKITIGRTAETISNTLEEDWVEKMTKCGANLQPAGFQDVIHCETYNIYSTPGHMACDGKHYYDVHLGVGKLVDAMKNDIESWEIDPFDR